MQVDPVDIAQTSTSKDSDVHRVDKWKMLQALRVEVEVEAGMIDLQTLIVK